MYAGPYVCPTLSIEVLDLYEFAGDNGSVSTILPFLSQSLDKDQYTTVYKLATFGGNATCQSKNYHLSLNHPSEVLYDLQ